MTKTQYIINAVLGFVTVSIFSATVQYFTGDNIDFLCGMFFGVYLNDLTHRYYKLIEENK